MRSPTSAACEAHAAAATITATRHRGFMGSAYECSVASATACEIAKVLHPYDCPASVR